MIWRIWSCFLNYFVRLSDSRKTTDTLGPPFKEGDKFVQEICQYPSTQFDTFIRQQKYHGPDSLGACKENCFLTCPKLCAEPKSRYWKCCFWGIVLTAIRLYFIPAGMLQLSKTSPLQLCWRPPPPPTGKSVRVFLNSKKKLKGAAASGVIFLEALKSPCNLQVVDFCERSRELVWLDGAINGTTERGR